MMIPNPTFKPKDIVNYAHYYYMRNKKNYHITTEEKKRLLYFNAEIKHQLLPCIEKRLESEEVDGIIFTFHALLKEKEKILNITGIENFQQHSDKHNEMIGLHFKKSFETNRNYLWVLVTNKEFTPSIEEIDFHKENNHLCIINCDLDTSQLMFERVCAAHALSTLISKYFNIACLDGDAFPMQSFDPIWLINRDILLTSVDKYLDTGIMPINEGVFFVKKAPKGIFFFNEYIKIYSLLNSDSELLNYYKKSIKRWRGGQLALNVLSKNYNKIDDNNKFSIHYLKCHKFNCFPKYFSPINRSKKYVIHIKGGEKEFQAIRETLK